MGPQPVSHITSVWFGSNLPCPLRVFAIFFLGFFIVSSAEMEFGWHSYSSQVWGCWDRVYYFSIIVDELSLPRIIGTEWFAQECQKSTVSIIILLMMCTGNNWRRMPFATIGFNWSHWRPTSTNVGSTPHPDSGLQWPHREPVGRAVVNGRLMGHFPTNGGFHKWGYPKMEGLHGKTIYKWMIYDLGVHPFQEISKWCRAILQKKHDMNLFVWYPWFLFVVSCDHVSLFLRRPFLTPRLGKRGLLVTACTNWANYFKMRIWNETKPR
jgi:hypothetical protein